MDAAAGFFFAILALQAVFTGAVVILVGRRFPARLKVYRLVAPAALPVLLFALVTYSYLSTYLAIAGQTGAAFNGVILAPLFRIFLAYAVLWLFGVIFASIIIRFLRR